MPSRKLKHKSSSGIVKAKLYFLVALIIGGIIVSGYVMRRKSISPSSRTSSSANANRAIQPANIKGQVQAVMDSANLETLSEKAQEAKLFIINAAHETFDNTASQAGEVATDVLFDSAVKPIVQQIDRLPQPQQVKLREYMCE